MCISRRQLSNAYFLAKFGLDTADKKKKSPVKFAVGGARERGAAGHDDDPREEVAAPGPPGLPGPEPAACGKRQRGGEGGSLAYFIRLVLGCIETKFCK